MFSYVPFKYKTVSWSRPVGWTTAQEIQMGEQVHRFGKDHFIKQFLAPPATAIEEGPPAMHGPGETPSFTFRPFSKDRPPDRAMKFVPKSQEPKSKAKAIGAGTVAVGALVATGMLAPHILSTALAAGTYAGGMYYGSKRFALWKFNRWLNHCEGKYLESLKPAIVPPPVPPPMPVIPPPVPAPVPQPNVPQTQGNDLLRGCIVAFVVVSVVLTFIVIAARNAPQSRPTLVLTPEPSPTPQYRDTFHDVSMQDSIREAQRLYPDLLKRDSPLAIEAESIVKTMQDHNDPRLYLASAPMWVATLAAYRVAGRNATTITLSPAPTVKVAKSTPSPIPRKAATPKATASPQIVAAAPPRGPWLKATEMPAEYMEVQFVDWAKQPGGRWYITRLGGRYPNGVLWQMTEAEAFNRAYGVPLFARTSQGYTRVYASDRFEDGTLSLHTWADKQERFILMELPKFPER